jgi:hypothetical protein
VDVRPLRRTHAPTTGSQHPPADASSTASHNQAHRLRALQLDPRPRGGTETSSSEETHHNSQPRGDYQVTGSGQHALLTAKAPMGG